MAVNWIEKTEQELLPIDGVSLFVAQAGIKKENYNDVTVFVLNEGTTASGVFTLNRFCAAPVQICQERLAQNTPIRALVVNTGNANAGTGHSGRKNAKLVCRSLAAELNLNETEVLPFSTGVILEPLPAEKIIQALPSRQQSSWGVVARAIMTTDTVAKAASREIKLDGVSVKLTGIAKGSGMICPNMATMLGFIATDAKIDQNALNNLVREVADESFNCITVDGDTSTNDSFVIMATGQAQATPITDKQSQNYLLIKGAMISLALELAQAIVRDGEGATKFMSIRVNQATSRDEARQVAYAIAHSPLVKTAFFASDPNLGRLLCAIGYSDVENFDVSLVKLYLDDVLVAENGGRAESYKEEDGVRILTQDEITVTVDLGRGNEQTTVYTCDFSYEYVKINADYRS